MSRPKNPIPKFSIDATGRAFTKVKGKFITLGRGDDPKSRLKYAEILRELATDAAPAATGLVNRTTISEVCLRFCATHFQRYQTSSGVVSAEIRCFKGVIRILDEMFGPTLADEFGPLRLRAVRQAMIKRGWSRKFINKQVGRLRLIFRVGVSWEIVSKPVADALKDVAPLIPGETAAPERTARCAVPQADLDTVRQRLRQRNRDLFDLMLLSGCRSGELLALTTGIIDRNGEIWWADLSKHKTSHKGKLRTLFFNASAQLILKRYLQADPDARIFPVRGDTFSEAIKSACERAGVTPFTPHALRHTVATKLADEVGIEGAQRLLGHSGAAMTRHYSQSAEKQAIAAVRKLG